MASSTGTLRTKMRVGMLLDEGVEDRLGIGQLVVLQIDLRGQIVGVVVERLARRFAE